MVTQAVVLAGGRGTRLGSLTGVTPKPMLPIAHRPFLLYVLLNLKRYGIARVIFATGYLGEQIHGYFRGGELDAMQICFSFEETPMGTGGALLLARKWLDKTFFVLNGDTLFDADLIDLAALLKMHPSALGAIALRRADDVGRYGTVLLDGDLVTGFAEKQRTGPGWINGGIYCLRRQALDCLPEGPCSIEQDAFPRLVERDSLVARPYDRYFIDIGLPETLAQAEKELPEWAKANDVQLGNL